MSYWMWNSGLSSAAIREQVILGLFERSNQAAAGPTCSLFPEAQRHERRINPDRRINRREPNTDRRIQNDRRRYGQLQASFG